LTARLPASVNDVGLVEHLSRSARRPQAEHQFHHLMAQLLASVNNVGLARPIIHLKENYQLQICYQFPEMLIF
jgi:hypothetical protein